MDIIQLRKFGLTLAFVFGGIGLFTFIRQDLILWPFEISAGLFLLSLIYPRWLGYVYTPWMKIGHVLGFINTRILLGIFFFTIITPIGLSLRLLKKDPLTRYYEKDKDSYRKITPPQPIQHMERPF